MWALSAAASFFPATFRRVLFRSIGTDRCRPPGRSSGSGCVWGSDALRIRYGNPGGPQPTTVNHHHVFTKIHKSKHVTYCKQGNYSHLKKAKIYFRKNTGKVNE